MHCKQHVNFSREHCLSFLEYYMNNTSFKKFKPHVCIIFLQATLNLYNKSD